VIERNPNFSHIYISWGDVREALGDHKEAIKDYTQAIEIYPEDDIGYSHRGAAH
jgi:tetratricopeptide (TPR) repeat protein